MKKFLSMVMALVMVMSLVTISAGAKDFTDNETITYSEAVAVVSEVGIVDGYPDGTFKPTNTLTRQAAAKIICNLILGPTTAAELHANVAPYPDVPANSEFAGYIAYCQQRGIISGYADGNFRPGNTLTGYAFMKMLLGALGYDASLEGYAGNPNWSINVAKQALGIGLNKGLEGEFNGIKAVNREEACLYAFRTLQADLVEYGQRLTTNINGTEVTLSSGGAHSKRWDTQSQMTRIDNIRDDDIIQFAEEYFRKLEKKKDTDAFERPAYTWIYDKEEIGTYVDWELLVEEYNVAVTGREVYDLLGATTIRENELLYFVDGVEPDATHPENGALYTNKVNAAHNIGKSDLVRNNQSDLGATGRGVLTQVFLDKDFSKDEGRITIVSINTWLAQAAADYNDKREELDLTVYVGATGKKTDSGAWVVALEDVPSIADMVENDFSLVNISFKDNTKGDVVIMQEPDILEESVVTKYSKDSTNVASKLTTGGTEYKNNKQAFYSDDALSQYDTELLTDTTYDIYMDQYGNFIGVKLHEGTKRYVFITGFDRPTSNLSISTAKANGIFLDGTMQNITVNVTKTNQRIDTWATTCGDADNYYVKWNENKLPGTDGSYRYNRWFSYSVNSDGVYTLKPVNMTATDYTAGQEPTLRTSNVYVDDNIYDSTKDRYGIAGLNKYSNTRDERAYANDDSVFITVDTDDVDTSNPGKLAITEVTGVFTGIQDIEIELDKSKSTLEEAMIYTVYDDDHYIIGAVTVGEAKGSNATIAFVTSKAKSEAIEGNTYYWEFDAILNGTNQTLTVKGDYDLFTGGTSMIDNEANKSANSGFGKVNTTDGLVELRFDADNYVVAIRPVAEADIYSYYGDQTQTPKWKGGNSLGATSGASGDRSVGAGNVEPTSAANGLLNLRDAKAYRMNVIRTADAKAWNDTSVSPATFNFYDSAPNKLTLVGRTLYVTGNRKDEGLSLASDCKAIVIQDENQKTNVLTEYSSVNTAIRNLAMKPGTTDVFEGEIVAVMNSNGAAAWVLFKSHNVLQTNPGKPTGGSNKLTGLTAVGFDNNGDTHNDWVNVTLTGVNAGDRYELVLTDITNFNSIEIGRRTVTATTGGTEIFTNVWTSGELTEGRSYMIQCGNYRWTFTF